MLHKDNIADDIHIIHAWEVADAAARTALTVGPTDVGKVALQLDTKKFYVLNDDTGPVWQLIGDASGAASTGVVAKVRVNFTRTGAMTLIGATNIASVTRGGTGRFTFTFTSAIPANCIALLSGRFSDSSDDYSLSIGISRRPTEGLTTAKCDIVCDSYNLIGGPYDPYDPGGPDNAWVYIEIKDPTAF